MTPSDILRQARTEHFTWVDYCMEGKTEVPFDADEEQGTETKLELLPCLLKERIPQLPDRMARSRNWARTLDM